MYTRQRVHGFSLMELMIAVAVIGILGAIAYPSYQSSQQKSRRSDAFTALMKEAALQERFAIQNNGCYSSTALGGSTSANGYYSIAAAASGCSSASPSYTLTATATGIQVKDTSCATLTLNNLGNKTPASGCW